MMGRTVIGIHIEGIGQAALDGTTGESGGIMWATDPHQVAAGTQGYDWATVNGRALLIDEFESLNDTAEPFSTRLEASAQDFQFHAHDAIAERFRSKQTQAPYSLAAALGDGVGDTSVNIGTTGLDNTVVYIHRETILLGTDSGGGVYTGCTRGYYGSAREEHANSSNVYTDVPRWVGRMVTMYSHDLADGTFIQRGRYRITAPGKGNAIEMGVTRLTLHTVSILAPLDSLQINLGGNTVDAGEYSLRAISGPESYGSPTYIGGSVTHTATVRKEALWSADNEIATYLTGEAVFATKDQVVQDSRILNTHTVNLSGLSQLSARGDEVGDPVYEVFVVARLYDNVHATAISSTKDLSHPYHPLAIAASLLLSTDSTTSAPSQYDVLQSAWSANLLWLFDDAIITTITNLIDAAPWMEIDQLLLGDGGDPIEIVDVVRKKLLSPWGFQLGMTTEGKLTIYYVGLTGVDDYESARANLIQPIQGTLLDADGQANTVDIIRADVGKLPWNKGNTIYVRAVDGDDERASKLKGDPSLVLDYSTIDAGRYQWVVNQVIQRALIQHFAIPRLTFSVNDHVPTGADYDHGAHFVMGDIPLRNAWLVDRSGTRIKSLSNDVEFVGQIYGRAMRPKDAFAFELEAMFVADGLVRWRAPSGVISSVDSATNTITLVSEGMIEGVTDADYFTVGDEIGVINQNGTEHERTYPIIAAINGDDLVLDAWFSVDPSADQIVRLAPYDSDGSGVGYQADGLDGAYTYVERVYVFLADAAETLGDAEESADIYGA